jgi:hypothetical protein
MVKYNLFSFFLLKNGGSQTYLSCTAKKVRKCTFGTTGRKRENSAAGLCTGLNFFLFCHHSPFSHLSDRRARQQRHLQDKLPDQTEGLQTRSWAQ